LRKVLEGQERIKNQLDSIQEELQGLKETVEHMRHQKEEVLNTFVHAKKELELMEAKAQVLNRRLFRVEAEVEKYNGFST